MLPLEFQREMNRLEETFGSRAFPKARVELIWNATSDMDGVWFKRLVDKMIGDLRQPPMVSDFRDAAYRERQSRFSQDTVVAAERWDSGTFSGLPRHLKSIGTEGLVNAVEQERSRIKNEKDDFDEGT